MKAALTGWGCRCQWAAASRTSSLVETGMAESRSFPAGTGTAE
uniref:Uncharacterized protein n=1 Tax=Arundo donax TaxID=35708 RepID=A0A0A9DDR0_ARUDO